MAASIDKFTRPTLSELNQVLERNPDKALALTGDGSIQLGAYILTPTGLQISRFPTYTEWEQLGDVLRKLDGALQWLIGDWLVQGQQHFEIDRARLAALVDRDLHTFENYAWVARSIPHSLRRELLSFGHHMLAAGLDTELEKEEWLAAAVENKWSISQMRAAMAGNRPTLSENVDPFEREYDAQLHQYLKAGQGDRPKYVALWRRLIEAAERENLG